MWMDSTPHIRKITDKVKEGRPSEISDLERDVFTDEFVRRFELVVAPESELQHRKMVNKLRQDKDESLRDYFSRAQGILKTIGVDDNSEYRDRFVLGIYDEELSARAVDRGAASSKSLHQAIEVIQGLKAFDLIQENPAEVNAVVNGFAEFNIDSVLAGNFRPYAVAGVSSALPGRIISMEAHSTQESHQKLSLPVPSPFQRHKDEQQHNNHSSDYRGPPQRDSWRNRGKNYSKYQNNGRNRGEFEGKRHAPSSQQRRSVDSTHPLANRSMLFKRACWNFGNDPTGTGPFHYSSECPGPMLMQWEQDILQSKSRENIAKPTASQVIRNRVSSLWQAYGENTPHQTGEPSGIHENFERDQKFGRSYSPQLQSQPIYKVKTVQFEEFLSRSDSSDQSEASRVNASGNAVDCFRAEYLLDELATIYPARGIEKEDTWFK
ncbi:hypothetical protein GcM3_194025 [Golovinomyces cichoracearum]|uniref:Retrotransposon gag domain-containing protein n=1 Tax=Golovinomyces cichoracearum TaxID=62708 RepID=A0A420HGI0_9PEZI|nr:hypothetical protein GcM3_194025 [Golovinomyces cichoracearum]